MHLFCILNGWSQKLWEYYPPNNSKTLPRKT